VKSPVSDSHAIVLGSLGYTTAVKELAVVAVSVLVASCLATGQAQAPNATVQAGPPIADERSQADNGTGVIPTFYSHARQVLVTVSVWKHGAKSAAWIPKEVVKRHPIFADSVAMPPVARGLSAKDFRIFDNGAEQKINYLEEFDFSVRDINEQWVFSPDIRGTWGRFTSADVALAAPTATYIIGYIPPPLQSGDCHTIRVVAGENDVLLNRTRYCNTDEGDTATAAGGKLAAQMENFAKSTSRGSIKVSSRPFVFWSSGVLSLMRDKPEPRTGSASPPSAANYTYVVVVHDSRAPATVQIATEYELGPWESPCPSDHPAIYVFGVVYKTNAEIATRFGDRFPCVDARDSGFDWVRAIGALARSVDIPSRFNTQVDLPPGDYDVHVVVSDGHKFGQARVPLRVEPIDSQALTISDIALNGILRDASWLLRDAAAVSPAPLVPAPLVSKHAQFMPVPDAQLRKTSSLPLYFEIYEPLLADQSAEVYFRMRITDLRDNTWAMNAGPTSAAQCVTPGNVVIPIALNVDTKKLQSGKYKIEIQASDSAGRTTEWRMAKFEIQ
jgi:hypothetical protein